MAVAKKDQERDTYAWMYGQQARKDSRERVPEYWQEQADAWLQGFDGTPHAGAGKAKPIGDQLEAEVDEAAVERPRNLSAGSYLGLNEHACSQFRQSMDRQNCPRDDEGECHLNRRTRCKLLTEAELAGIKREEIYQEVSIGRSSMLSYTMIPGCPSNQSASHPFLHLWLDRNDLLDGRPVDDAEITELATRLFIGRKPKNFRNRNFRELG